MEKAKAGFIGFGEVNTPRGLIETRCRKAREELEEAGVEIKDAGLVVDDPEGKTSREAVCKLSGAEFDVLIICVAGWIPSWAVFSTIEEFKHKPMVLLGLTGWREGERFVTTADQAGTTALRKPMEDMGYAFKYVVTRMGSPLPAGEVSSYCRAARCAAMLKSAKIGMAGYRDMRLYGTLYDGVSLKGKIGPEIEHFDLLELKQLMEGADERETKTLAEAMKRRWDFMKEPLAGTVENSVKLYLAIRRKVEERGYDAFSYSDVDGVKKLMGFAPAGAMTLLHDELNIPTVPENDSLGSVTQLMVRFLTGQAGAYLEFYEFTGDGAIMGVPDYVPAEIVEGRVRVLPNAFGDFGEGLLNVSKLKTGRATICRLSCAGGEYRLHAAEGTAKEPPLWEEAGWAQPAPRLPSIEFVFDGNPEDFIQNVAGQHYFISYGDNGGLLRELCRITGVKSV